MLCCDRRNIAIFPAVLALIITLIPTARGADGYTFSATVKTGDKIDGRTISAPGHAVINNKGKIAFTATVACAEIPQDSEQSLSFCDPGGEDVNGDGRPDLMCHFNSEDTGFQPGDVAAVLNGTTASGAHFNGSVSIEVR